MRVSEIRVGALIYNISFLTITFMSIDSKGRKSVYSAGDIGEIEPKLMRLSEELSNGMKIAHGDLPNLHDFIDNWGRQLLPPKEWFENIDVLVIVPRGNLHGIPLHLVLIDNSPLGALVGITYSSGMSLMSRCMDRNPLRKKDSADWEFGSDYNSPCSPRKLSAILGGVDVLGSKNDIFKGIVTEISNYVKGELRNFSSKDDPCFNEFDRSSWKTAFMCPNSSDILCIASHGYLDFNNHRMSGLLLARDKLGVTYRNLALHGGKGFHVRDLPLRDIPLDFQPNIDAEILTSAELEIDGLLNSELVALLGCSTSVGQIYSGDEPVSLAETFLHVGACSVISCLWDVSVEFIKEWCRYFFDGWLIHRLPKALAYQRSIQKIFSGKYKDYPEQFGCIVLKGDWL